MAFGVLFDFTGNTNVSKVIKTADLVKETWFLDAINYHEPIDLFVVIGHNPVRTTAKTSTFGLLYETIRGIRPDVPIQTFGGHTHVRYRAKISLRVQAPYDCLETSQFTTRCPLDLNPVSFTVHH